MPVPAANTSITTNVHFLSSIIILGMANWFIINTNSSVKVTLHKF